MRRRVYQVIVWAAAGSVAEAQPVGERPDGAARAHSLTDAARAGASSLTTARLDRLTDMATTDLAPLDDGAREPDEPAETAPWPGGARAAETAWSSCGFAGTAQPVDLEAGALLPMQVSLASRGDRAVALVAMGRPGADRRGMAFPESRWVEWSGGRVDVFPARGFSPGASLALGDREATVLSYTRPDPRTPDERASRLLDVDVPTLVALTRVGEHGRTLVGPNDLEGSDGWQIDSPAVLWRHGLAVVLGHPTAPPGDGARREVLHFLDARGHDVRAPLELSDGSREAGLGAAPAGLTAAPDGASLAAAWMVPSGPIAGVWVRRGITLDAQPFIPGTAHIVEGPTAPGRRRAAPLYPRGLWTLRVAQGEGFWGPQVSRGGVFFGRAGALDDAAPLTELLLAPWPVDGRLVPSRVLDAWWDPLAAWTPGGAMVAGFSPRGPSSRPLVVAYAARGERALRTITLPLDDGDARPCDGADLAFAPLDSGALIAWIDAADGDRARRLALAHVRCVPAAVTSPARSTRSTSAASSSR